eukprot:CAMPEP_0168380158 /NCGR_PEP_ID=MMETSP0228-20121227/12214_1 /TAXON_ID=133427 /ORGANISM="Protoceratium reticulatum, Strain CCCM 535 (=CCMP 1889)" /LENGTH=401 /DNA_ID=CAMNT_0008393211 /DNA_START=17 /DNA_END=1219 /DNA_ORIENTATION=-
MRQAPRALARVGNMSAVGCSLVAAGGGSGRGSGARMLPEPEGRPAGLPAEPPAGGRRSRSPRGDAQRDDDSRDSRASRLLPGRIQTELYLSRDFEREGSRRRSGPPNSALRKRRFISDSRRKCSATSPGACIRGAAGSAKEARSRTASSGFCASALLGDDDLASTAPPGVAAAAGKSAPAVADPDPEASDGSIAGTELAAFAALLLCLSASSRARSWSSSMFSSSSSSIAKAPFSFFCRSACLCSSMRRCSSRTLRSSAHLASCSCQRLCWASSSSLFRSRSFSSSLSRRSLSSSSRLSLLRRSSSVGRAGEPLRERERDRRCFFWAYWASSFACRAAALTTSPFLFAPEPERPCSLGLGFNRYAGLRRDVISPGIGASAVPALCAIGLPGPGGLRGGRGL